jgi:hypothetical protein
MLSPPHRYTYLSRSQFLLMQFSFLIDSFSHQVLLRQREKSTKKKRESTGTVFILEKTYNFFSKICPTCFAIKWSVPSPSRSPYHPAGAGFQPDALGDKLKSQRDKRFKEGRIYWKKKKTVFFSHINKHETHPRHEDWYSPVSDASFPGTLASIPNLTQLNPEL